MLKHNKITELRSTYLTQMRCIYGININLAKESKFNILDI